MLGGSRLRGSKAVLDAVDGDVLLGIVGSVDTLARERLDADVAGTGILVCQLCDVQNITFGHGGNPGAWIQR
jgi:hypothetical protein